MLCLLLVAISLENRVVQFVYFFVYRDTSDLFVVEVSDTFDASLSVVFKIVETAAAPLALTLYPLALDLVREANSNTDGVFLHDAFEASYDLRSAGQGTKGVSSRMVLFGMVRCCRETDALVSLFSVPLAFGKCRRRRPYVVMPLVSLDLRVLNVPERLRVLNV